MEKINTPIQDLIEEERKMLRMANSAIDLSSDEEEKEFFRSEKTKHLYAISMLKQALPKEREVIETAYESGYDLKPICLANGKDKICTCTNEVHCQHKYFYTSNDYYNQTFKTESDE